VPHIPNEVPDGSALSDGRAHRAATQVRGEAPPGAEQACGPLYEYDRDLYKERFVVERSNGWMKSFRRLRFRYDRTTASFEAFLYLAVIVIGVRRTIRS
jgi:transposase